MDPCELTVVIATYNRTSSLLQLLSQLESQTTPPSSFEVVVVDDGSLVPVRSVLEVRAWDFSLQLIEQQNAGQAVARHRGVLAARGRIVVILDDDMSVPPSFLHAHASLHEAGAEVVLGHIRPSLELAKMPLFERFHAAQLALFLEEVRAGKPIQGSALCTGNVSFRRELYLRVDGFDLALKRSEDRELGIRFQAAGARFAFSEQAYSTHGSDHTDLEVWLKRSYLYGVYDAKIGKKHLEDTRNDPWHYVFLVNALSRPLIAVSVFMPDVSKQLARVAFHVADAVATVGLETLALKGATVVFMLEYFRGVRDEAGSAGSSVRSFAAYLKRSRAGMRAAV